MDFSLTPDDFGNLNMAKTKTLIDELESFEGQLKPKRDLLSKLSEPIKDEISQVMKRWNNGELKDKFPNRTALAEWIYATMRKKRPKEFPVLNDVKYFSSLLGSLDA